MAYQPRNPLLLGLLGLLLTRGFVNCFVSQSRPRKIFIENVALNVRRSNDQGSGNDDTLEALQKVVGKVGILSSQLTSMERKLQQNRLEWMREKSMLTQKISLLTTLLEETTTGDENNSEKVEMVQTEDSVTNSDESNEEEAVEDYSSQLEALELELRMSHEYEDELMYEQERLEREVGLLQNEIIQIRNLHKTEHYKTLELAQQLDELQAERTEWEAVVSEQAHQIDALQIQLLEQQQQQQTQKPVAAVKYRTNGTQQESNGVAKKNGHSKPKNGKSKAS